MRVRLAFPCLTWIHRGPASRTSLGIALIWGLLTLAPTSAQADVKTRLYDKLMELIVTKARVTGRETSEATGSMALRATNQSFETMLRNYNDLTTQAAARGGRAMNSPSELGLDQRFKALSKGDAQLAEAFARLAPAEKKMLVELGETAGDLVRATPGNPAALIDSLGPQGLAAVRAYGPDVAEVIVREGPEAIDVLRKTGRPGWEFYTNTILAHRKKLAAAGVLSLYLANPEQFVDSVGHVTEYGARVLAEAGVAVAGAVASGAMTGLEGVIEQRLGLTGWLTRILGLFAALTVAVMALLVLVGLPLRTALTPILWPIQWLRRRGRSANPSIGASGRA
ncbi:hypothetical protein Isop_0921 [Isosphaera pallida ATCC 43644]|uniref:Uncharacterized protein n=1 Tax=Isosphaera pallida (strain ATCC 43644 / DSM 9630 / IS1B) TaxID=575540 RepID=E8R306_ISOPI|nr:hypothetical protein [Isosphaera pallida]ADV61510.1 hypothetical protein Isop_0921 [Isosphaera pallida ATCC 43644]